MKTTLKEAFKKHSCYFGDYGEWLIVAAVHRDSDCLARSNYRSFIRCLGGTGEEGAGGCQTVLPGLRIEEATHWACGWVQYLVIDPTNAELCCISERILAALEDYPAIDEEDFSKLETEEANEVWSKCYGTQKRIKYIREHRSQFEFRGFSDLLGCVRGNYFAGYASELLN